MNRQLMLSVMEAFRKHPEWDGTDPAVIEQELDVPAVDPEEEEDGFFLQRKDRVAEILSTIGVLMELGYVEGSISSVDDRLAYKGMRLTSKGREYLSSL